MKKLSIGNQIISVDVERLVNRSDYFKNLLFGPYKEGNNDIVKIEGDEITCRIIEALSKDVAFPFGNIPQLVEAVRQVNYFGIDISTNIFEKLDVSPEYYEDFCSLIDILGCEYYLLRSIVYNKPKNYNLSELPITDHHLYDSYLITHDETIKIWSMEGNKYIYTIKCNSKAEDIYLSSNKKYLIYRCDNKVIVYDIIAKTINYSVKITLECISYCAQTNLLCFVKHDILSIIDVNQGCLLYEEKTKNMMYLVQFSDKGDILYTTSAGKIDIYKLEIKKGNSFINKTRSIIFEEIEDLWMNPLFCQFYYFQSFMSEISIASSSDHNYLAISYGICAMDGKNRKICVKLYDTTSGKLIWEFIVEYWLPKTCHFWNNYLVLRMSTGIAIYDIESLRIVSEYSIPNSNFFIYHDRIYLLSDNRVMTINLSTNEIEESELDAFHRDSFHRRLPNTKNFISTLKIIKSNKHNINIDKKQHVYFPKSRNLRLYTKISRKNYR